MTSARPEFDSTRLDAPENPLPELPSAAEIGEIIGLPPEHWHMRCHEVSIAIVAAGIVPHARIARGWCCGVPGQHSWIVGPTADGRLGDCLADNAVIIDPTLHTYRDDVTGIYVSHADVDEWHRPHGKGPHITAAGRPPKPKQAGKVIALAAEAFDELDSEARWWLHAMFGPLDRSGWGALANTTMIGWPSDQIVRAMARTRALAVTLPIDIIGMLTNLDPEGLYLHPDDVDPAVAAQRERSTATA